MIERVRRVLAAILGVAAVVWIVRIVAIFAARLTYPFDLEWMEGGMLAHAWRLQRGLALYGPPNPDFVPFVYPPGYAAVVAAVGDVVGLDYAAGRWVSGGSTVLAAAAIAFVAFRQLRTGVGALVGAACYLALIRASGGFYDLVRPDALGMALLAWSVAMATERSRGADIASGLLLCAAFLVKHNFAAFGIPLVALIGLRSGLESAGRFVVASAMPALAWTIVLQVQSDGGFLTYILGVPGSHPMAFGRMTQGLPGELGLVLLPALVGIAGWFVVMAVESSARPGRVIGLIGTVGLLVAIGGWFVPVVKNVGRITWPVMEATFVTLAVTAVAAGIVIVQRRGEARVVGAVGVAAMALLVAGLMRAHYGGFMNVVMPAHWAIATGLALGIGWAEQRADQPVAPFVALAVGGLQLGWMFTSVDLDHLRPTDEARAAGTALVEDLQTHCPEGRLLTPFGAWLPVQAGRDPSVHYIAIWDLNHAGGPYIDDMRDMMRTAARQGYWSCVLQGSNQRLRLSNDYGVPHHYDRKTRVSDMARRLGPRTGWRVSPYEILGPKEGR